MVGAADAVLFGDAVREVRLAVGAGGLDAPELAAGRTEQDEVLAQETNLLGRVVFVQLDAGGDGVPVAPHDLAHRRSGPDLGEPLILLRGQHMGLPFN